MALRVLLADESTTIKKVMQLALQDFAVEVKAVHVGLDVVEVARQFQPDIIFADVLLQKKNGYEVCGELKRDPGLKTIPVVLMWSSFMDLDESLAQDCGADRRLEKPFDIENLRQVLLELVPKTHTQRLAHFLKFPASMTEPMEAEEAQKRQQPQAPPSMAVPPPPKPAPPKSPFPLARPHAQATQPSIRVTPPPVETPAPPPAAVPDPNAETRPGWNMQSFDEIDQFDSSAPIEAAGLPSAADDDDDDENFSEFRIQSPAARGYTGRPPAASESELPPPAEENEEPWSHQDLSRFKLDLPPVTASNAELGIDLELSDDGLPRSPSPYSPPASDTRTNLAPIDGTAYGLSDFSADTDARSLPSLGMPSQMRSANDLLLDSEEIAAGQEIGPDLTLEETPDAGDLQLSTSVNNDEATFITRSQSRSTLPTDDFPADEAGKIPQLSPDRLEQIIRVQSREIIESVVRRVVPDLASDIIREELQRLLEDTAVRERR